MVCHIFLAESEAKQNGPRKEVGGARAPNTFGGRGFEWKVPRERARRGRLGNKLRSSRNRQRPFPFSRISALLADTPDIRAHFRDAGFLGWSRRPLLCRRKSYR